MSEEATELSIGLAFLILFVCTCLKALIVEGLVLLLFRFDMERDGVPFLAIVIEPPLEKPVVPSFNYHSAGDTYIDLGWEFTPGHYYYLKYGLKTI